MLLPPGQCPLSLSALAVMVWGSFIRWSSPHQPSAAGCEPRQTTRQSPALAASWSSARSGGRFLPATEHRDSRVKLARRHCRVEMSINKISRRWPVWAAPTPTWEPLLQPQPEPVCMAQTRYYLTALKARRYDWCKRQSGRPGRTYGHPVRYATAGIFLIVCSTCRHYYCDWVWSAFRKSKLRGSNGLGWKQGESLKERQQHENDINSTIE
jgi:hypothetical protein